jgi:hypothetical protein
MEEEEKKGNSFFILFLDPIDLQSVSAKSEVVDKKGKKKDPFVDSQVPEVL